MAELILLQWPDNQTRMLDAVLALGSPPRAQVWTSQHVEVETPGISPKHRDLYKPFFWLKGWVSEGGDVVCVGCGLIIVPLNSLWLVFHGVWSLSLLREGCFCSHSFSPLKSGWQHPFLSCRPCREVTLFTRRTSPEQRAHVHFLPVGSRQF